MPDYNSHALYETSRQILHVLDHYAIHRAHFLGLSLGTIVIHVIEDIAPDRIQSKVLGGSVEYLYIPIVKFFKSLRGILSLLPYMWLYKIVALCLMPRKRNREARFLFVNEAVKLGKQEFFKWYELLYTEVNHFYDHRKLTSSTPVLFIMGDADFVFLPILRNRIHIYKNGTMHVLEQCGHVCNIEQHEQFNNLALNFMKANANVEGTNYKSKKVV